jgi:hypothetical protein
MSEHLFFILLGVSPEMEAEFNTVYDTDHLPYMVQIPGVRDCTRYKLDWSDNADMLAYLALYHIDDPDLPRSDLWKKHAAMGRWSRDIRPHLKERRNGVYDQIFRAGAVSKGPNKDSTDSEYIYFLQQSIPANMDAKFNQLYNGDHIPLMLQTPGADSCTRYKLRYSDSGDVPDYLAIYAIDAAGTPRSPEWKKQTGLGAWPTQIRPHFTARRNGVYHRVSRITLKDRK